MESRVIEVVVIVSGCDDRSRPSSRPEKVGRWFGTGTARVSTGVAPRPFGWRRKPSEYFDCRSYDYFDRRSHYYDNRQPPYYDDGRSHHDYDCWQDHNHDCRREDNYDDGWRQNHDYDSWR